MVPIYPVEIPKPTIPTTSEGFPDMSVSLPGPDVWGGPGGRGLDHFPFRGTGPLGSMSMGGQLTDNIIGNL